MRRSIAAGALIVLAALTAPAGAAVPGGQPTNPTVSPTVGSPVSAFRLVFTSREQLGVTGFQQTEYRIQVDPPAGAPTDCAAGALAPVTQGMPGQQITLALLPGSGHGWCTGRYAVAVLFDRGPYCPPPPADGGPPTPCPLYAAQEVDTGDTSFEVRAADTRPPPPHPALSARCLRARHLVQRTTRRLVILRRRAHRAHSPRARRSARRAVRHAEATRRSERRAAAALCAT